jgi:hypothetical protein
MATLTPRSARAYWIKSRYSSRVKLPRGLLVGGLKALRVGAPFEKAADMPVGRHMGLKDAQFGWIVGDGCDCGQYGQGAGP